MIRINRINKSVKELVVKDIFDDLPIKKQVKIGNIIINVPTKYFGRVISGVFSIPTKNIKDFIKTDKLKPVQLTMNKSVVIITVFDNFNSPVGPYKEIVLATPVLYNSRISIPLLPLLFRSKFQNLGFFVFLIASNTDLSRQEGNFFGYPHYEKNINILFQTDKTHLYANLKENNTNILLFKIKQLNKENIEKFDYQTFFIKKNKLFSIKMNTIAIVGRSLNRNNGILKLGDHAISDTLKKMKINLRPIEVSHYRDTIEVLNSPEEITEV